MSPPAAPVWARRLLERALPADAVGRSVLADLEEELHDVANRRGWVRARAWYGWQAVEIAAHYAWTRLWATAFDGREEGGVGMVETVGRNVRTGLRRLRRRPGFAVVAVLTMALGIGANVAIFSVVRQAWRGPPRGGQ